MELTEDELFEIMFQNQSKQQGKFSTAIIDAVNDESEAAELRQKISNGCRGSDSMANGPSTEHSQKHNEANANFKDQRYFDALSIYETLADENPEDDRFFTNIALCLVKTRQYEPAIVSASIVARYLDRKKVKAQLWIVYSFCKLGYAQLATDYAKTLAKYLPAEDMKTIESQIDLIAHPNDGTYFVTADSVDFENTVMLMLTPVMRIENLLFLLTKCMFHFDTQGYSKSVDQSVSLIEKVQHIATLVRDKKFVTRFASFNRQQFHLILCYMTFVARFCQVSKKFAKKLVTQPNFITLMNNLSKIYMDWDQIRVIMQHPPFGQVNFNNTLNI